jgi:deoxyadenosine/deoxycytidine kinase
MIAIEGNVASGKSTLIRRLRDTLKCAVYLEPVKDWSQQLKSFYRDPRRYALPLQLKVLTSFLKQSKQDDGLIERSPISSRYIFGTLLTEDGLLTEPEVDTYISIYDALGPLLVDPQSCIYVWSPPDQCFHRASQRGRAEEANLQPDYLLKLHKAHEELFSRRTSRVCDGVFHCTSPCYSQVVWIDGSRTKEDVLQASLRAVEYLTSASSGIILDANGNGETG